MRYLILLFLILIFIYLNLKDKKEHYNDKKYINFIVKSNAGISHQKSNLNYLFKEAYGLNKILIIPKFHLTSTHNNNKKLESNLSKYYDYEKLKVNDEKFPVILDNSEIDKSLVQTIDLSNSKYGLVRLNPKLQHIKKEIKIELPYHPKILKEAQIIQSMLGKYLCLHIRRGDMLNMKPNLKKDTSIENIKEKLRKYEEQVKNIYIMTNEQNTNYLSQLKKINPQKIKLYSDYPVLDKIQKEDNYYLFCIEKIIMEKANLKISTFKTPNSNYIDNLSNLTGWQ